MKKLGVFSFVLMLVTLGREAISVSWIYIYKTNILLGQCGVKYNAGVIISTKNLVNGVFLFINNKMTLVFSAFLNDSTFNRANPDNLQVEIPILFYIKRWAQFKLSAKYNDCFNALSQQYCDQSSIVGGSCVKF